MTNYTISKEMTIAKVKTVAKNDITERIMAAFPEAKMVRTGGTTKTNEIGLQIGEVTLEDGTVVPIVATINASVKEFVSRTTSKKTYAAFDLDAAAKAYEDNEIEKAEREAERKANKENK